MKWSTAPRGGLWILLYMVIFSFSQQLAMLLVSWYNMDKGMTFEEASKWVGVHQVPVVLAISALIGLPLMFLTVYQRKLRWENMIFQKRIKFKRLFFLFILGIVINQIASLILYLLQLLPGLEPLFQAYQQSMEVMVPNEDPRRLIILLGLVVPIYEEVLFRGLVFREFAAVIPIKWAIIAQAILFGVWHSTIIQGIYAFVLGILLCRVYVRHQSIWASCAVHCGFNITSYWLLYLLS